MERMIYLSILLATIQQPSSQNPSFKVAFGWKVWNCTSLEGCNVETNQGYCKLIFSGIKVGENSVCHCKNQYLHLNLTMTTNPNKYRSVLLVTTQPSSARPQVEVTFEFVASGKVDSCQGRVLCNDSEGTLCGIKAPDSITLSVCPGSSCGSNNHNSYNCNLTIGGNSSTRQDDLKFFNESKSWIDALEHCQSLNSSLVKVTNKSEVDLFLQNKTNQMQEGVWIGLERSIFGRNAPWMWVSGLKEDILPWNATYPVDRYNNHCGKIIWVGQPIGFKWLDECCHKKLPFICGALNKIPGQGTSPGG